MSEALTIYKLIILYTLDRVDFPLTYSQLTDFILGQEYTDYFQFQNSLYELAEAGLITVKKAGNTSRYQVTKEGSETACYFENQIPKRIRQEIRVFLKEHDRELTMGAGPKDSGAVYAEYTKTDRLEYLVHCAVREHDSPVIDLQFTVPVEDIAKNICDSWPQKSQQVYALIMSELMRETK